MAKSQNYVLVGSNLRILALSCLRVVREAAALLNTWRAALNENVTLVIGPGGFGSVTLGIGLGGCRCGLGGCRFGQVVLEGVWPRCEQGVKNSSLSESSLQLQTSPLLFSKWSSGFDNPIESAKKCRTLCRNPTDKSLDLADE